MEVRAPTRSSSPATPAGGFAFVIGPGQSPVVCVSGASGKSTTSAIVVDALRVSGMGVTIGGATAPNASRCTPAGDAVVYELPCDIAHMADGASVLALTGLSADELPPGVTPETARQAVRLALSAARQAIVVNADDPALASLSRLAAAPVWRASARDRDAHVHLDGDELRLRAVENGRARRICRLPDAAMASPALAMDVLVAAATAVAAGADPDALGIAVRRFAPPPDCQEVVAVRGGVRWVCDARADRPGRTVAALAASTAPVLLVAGGEAGGQPLEAWAVACAAAEYVLLYGTAAEAMAQAIALATIPTCIVRCAGLDDATVAASRLARRGDTILFSPGCSPGAVRAIAPADRFRDLATMPRSARAEAA